jgi:hypothetical protein
VLTDQFIRRSESDAAMLAAEVPWQRLSPAQIIHLFHDFHSLHEAFAAHVSLKEFNAADLAELLETVKPELFKTLAGELRQALGKGNLTLDDMVLLAGLSHAEEAVLSALSIPPADYDGPRVLSEFRDASETIREILFFSCRSADFFHELFLEAWERDPRFLKRYVKKLAPGLVGPFLVSAAGSSGRELVSAGKKTWTVRFDSAELNAFFAALPVAKKKAAITYLRDHATPITSHSAP